MIVSLALFVALAVPADTVAPLRAEAAAVVVHRQPALPLVALRLSLLADDPPGYAGAGHLVQHLVYPRLQEQVRRVGGRALIERNSDALVYTVVGPAAELPYLAQVLRSALVTPPPSAPTWLAAQRGLTEERLETWETAGQHIRSALRTQLFPRDLPAAGTEASLDRLSPESLGAVWEAIYEPSRVSVVAVGDVEVEEVRRAFAELPPAAVGIQPSATDTVYSVPPVPPQATNGWFGVGYSATDTDPAALLVTARLLRDALREEVPTATVETEHWWTHHGQALAAIVAAPEPDLERARRAMGSALSLIESDLDAEHVRAAATAVRRDMLFFARTPEGMAELIGRFADRSGKADRAQEFYAELDAVSVADVREVMDRLMPHTPVRIEVPPQELPEAR